MPRTEVSDTVQASEVQIAACHSRLLRALTVTGRRSHFENQPRDRAPIGASSKMLLESTIRAECSGLLIRVIVQYHR